ncbi:hypothetical protein L1987_57456 [Smallanthus sonchifolius]|uniref:Uncharacterized protein n=1 Tax=Smallanthus sonchifolius TaxID=185202 RepID=A0ACB9DCV7_9ASTR|nr:hypothetical protein L1987_57456 [Smallanthus sonchifolius]
MAANKITLILLCTVLEWTLIILLLLHSVFSSFIIKFARYFGLNPPCFSCARINRSRYHLCELHSKEVSELKFCSNHQKLAEFGHMCENCSSPDLGFRKESRNFVFSKVERIDEIQGEIDLKCSCCGGNFERKFVDESSCFVTHHIEKEVADDRMGSNYVEENQEIENREQSEELETEEHDIEVVRESNCVEEDLIQFENGEDLNSLDLDQLFPFELCDPKIEEHPGSFEDEDHEFGDFQIAQMNSQEIIDSIHQKTENLIDFRDEEIQTPLIDTEELQDSHSVHEEDVVSIGTHIPVLDSCDEIKHEEPSTTSNNLDSDFENGSNDAQGEGNAGDLKNLSVKVEEIEEDKAPETPSGMYSPNPFHKRWLIPKTKDWGAEESFDGSVISETDGGDPVNTAEKLKSALKAEQKALRDLYMELEEERNASAVAANQTMAMINRLQEEKAATQMEALQYRRMMEEQSEYDQEALQLLNELMMKKEKELDSYRKKASDYEKMRTGSVSWSRSEDDEGSSVDLYHVPEDENALDEDRVIQHPHTSVDSVLDLESALANFEEERVSILEQLKILEEKLVALSDEEEQHFANVRRRESSSKELHRECPLMISVTNYTRVKKWCIMEGNSLEAH